VAVIAAIMARAMRTNIAVKASDPVIWFVRDQSATCRA
jgi:hypothetical protein